MMRGIAELAAVALAAVLLSDSVQAELGDIAFTRPAEAAGGEFPPAVFPHWVHRLQFACYVCHEDIFKMKVGANSVTMSAISAGQYCGACHNGKIAFSVVFESCPRCHHQ